MSAKNALLSCKQNAFIVPIGTTEASRPWQYNNTQPNRTKQTNTNKQTTIEQAVLLEKENPLCNQKSTAVKNLSHGKPHNGTQTGWDAI